MKFYCRELEGKDSQKYRAVRLESLRLHPEYFGSSYETQRKLPKLYFEELIESGTKESVMIGAFFDDELVGLCGLIPVNNDSLEIIQMYVSLECRGKALGCQMLLKAKSILLSRPESELTLTVFSKNHAAIRVYEKFGFEQIEKNGNELVMIFKGEQVGIS